MVSEEDNELFINAVPSKDNGLTSPPRSKLYIDESIAWVVRGGVRINELLPLQWSSLFILLQEVDIHAVEVELAGPGPHLSSPPDS